MPANSQFRKIQNLQITTRCLQVALQLVHLLRQPAQLRHHRARPGRRPRAGCGEGCKGRRGVASELAAREQGGSLSCARPRLTSRGCDPQVVNLGVAQLLVARRRPSVLWMREAGAGKWQSDTGEQNLYSCYAAASGRLPTAAVLDAAEEVPCPRNVGGRGDDSCWRLGRCQVRGNRLRRGYVRHCWLREHARLLLNREREGSGQLSLKRARAPSTVAPCSSFPMCGGLITRSLASPVWSPSSESP